MPLARVIELRKLLAEKFPGSSAHNTEHDSSRRNCWTSGMPQLDAVLQGGLPKGELTEIIAACKSCGSASLVRAILDEAAKQGHLIAMVDGSDSLDVTSLNTATLNRLLWVRCRSVNEALKAADLILRDSNLSLVLLDLAGIPAAELRRISATTWYRWQRLLERVPTVCVILTSCAMVTPARARIQLHSRFSIESLDANAETILRGLRPESPEAAQLQAPTSQQFA